MSLMLRFSIYILPQKIISKEKSWFLKFEKSSILLNVFSVFLKVQLSGFWNECFSNGSMANHQIDYNYMDSAAAFFDIFIINLFL